MIAFERTKLSKAENNYSTMEREGLAMVYALQNYRHYFLCAQFKMYTHYSALKYLVNKLVSTGASMGEQYHTTCIHIGGYILRKK